MIKHERLLSALFVIEKAIVKAQMADLITTSDYYIAIELVDNLLAETRAELREIYNQSDVGGGTA